MLACQEPAAAPASFLQIFLVESILMILPYIDVTAALSSGGAYCAHPHYTGRASNYKITSINRQSILNKLTCHWGT